MNLFWIFIGGGLGSVLRFGAGWWLYKIWQVAAPWPTLAINLLGSFLIGFLFSALAGKGDLPGFYTGFLIIGFCGGFTTFSTFSYENLLLIQAGEYNKLIFYILTSVIAGILFAYIGWKIGLYSFK